MRILYWGKAVWDWVASRPELWQFLYRALVVLIPLLPEPKRRDGKQSAEKSNDC